MNWTKIDALVAEHVMGWVNNKSDPTQPGMYGIMDWIYEDDGSRRPVPVPDFPSYSDDLVAAFDVVEELSRQMDVHLSYQSLATPLTGVELKWFAEATPRHLGGSDVSVYADTAPAAICLLALKVRGVNIPMEIPT